MRSDSLRPCFTVNEAAEYLQIPERFSINWFAKVGSRPLRSVRALSFEAPRSNVFLTSSKQRRSVSVATMPPRRRARGRARLC